MEKKNSLKLDDSNSENRVPSSQSDTTEEKKNIEKTHNNLNEMNKKSNDIMLSGKPDHTNEIQDHQG